MSLQLIGIQIPVEYNEINVNRIQNQLNGHEHGYKIPAGKKAINTYKKNDGADYQKMSNWNTVDHWYEIVYD
jgi:hypothetical protein